MEPRIFKLIKDLVATDKLLVRDAMELCNAVHEYGNAQREEGYKESSDDHETGAFGAL